MRIAIRLSEENVRGGKGGPFGAVIVRDGTIIAQSANTVVPEHDPTAHAEVAAIRLACKAIGSYSLEGCTIYASCEPCPMCLAAIYWARISKLYYANTNEDAADIGFDDDFIYQEIEKPRDDRKIPAVRILRDEAQQVFSLWKISDQKIDY